MKTPLPLLVIALLAATGGFGPAPADATPGATCHGRPATIVSDNGQVWGTDGPDVIVASGYVSVRAGAGDDIICASGKVDSIDGGSGNDLVDVSGNTAPYSQVTLGTGSDRFIGSTKGEQVWGAGFDGQVDQPDTAFDRIQAGGGADHVFSGAPGSPDNDRIETGPGGDRVELRGEYAGVRLDVGDGHNALSVSSPQQDAGPWQVIAWAHTVEQGEISWTWQGGDVMSFDLDDSAANLTFKGSRVDESVTLTGTGSVDTVDTGGGDDQVYVSSHPADGSRYLLGFGDDLLSISGAALDGSSFPESFVHVDLGAGRIDYSPQAVTPAATVSGVEVLDANATITRVEGSEKSETIVASGCRVTVSGEAGADRLERVNGGLGHCPVIVSRLLGGAGGDTLVGSRQVDDVLIGGAGHDVADGLGGVDRCRAEVELNCEG